MNAAMPAAMTSGAAAEPVPEGAIRRPQYRAVTAAAGLVAAGILYLSTAVGVRQAALFVVGTLAGLILYHAAFGFTSAWRALITDRRGVGVRAHMLLFAVTALVFFPALASGQLFGMPVRGAVSPLSIGLVAGAFMFGVGMQLAGGCASGTLYTLGGGSTRMVVTLGAFIVGSVVGVWHHPAWQALPALPAVSLIRAWGAPLALFSTLVLLGSVTAVTCALERHRHGRLESILQPPQRSGPTRWWSGPWPLLWGAIGLAAVNVATLVLAGRPWGVTSAFALWGSKLAAAAGVSVTAWPYWSSRVRELDAAVFQDVTSVMDFGIVLGAFGAAAMASRFAPEWRLEGRHTAAALLGGLLLGYGARIAYGCNIGAYFSGIASGSLHGWIWGLAAFAGSVCGTSLRPLFFRSQPGVAVGRADMGRDPRGHVSSAR